MTPKRQRFVDEYLIDLNATQAATRAGYAQGSADVTGARLLGDARVAKAIAEAIAARAARTDVTQDWVLERLARLAGVDPRRHMTWGPDGVTLLPSAGLSDAEAYAVAEVSETTTKDGGSLRLKTHDKVRALELLGKHLGMFVEKHEHQVKGALTLEAARQLMAAGDADDRAPDRP